MKTSGPDLDMYLEGKRKGYVTYVQGASIYRMNYYTFVRLAKEAGANIRSRKTVVVDLDIFDLSSFLSQNYHSYKELCTDLDIDHGTFMKLKHDNPEFSQRDLLNHFYENVLVRMTDSSFL